jgi:hypothetical protein
MTNEEILESSGWQIDCESPFEISHEDGSFATLNAANIVLQSFKDSVQHSISPCPKCESKDVHYEFSSSQGYIICRNCDFNAGDVEEAADPICSTQAAIDSWNRVAEKSPTKDLLKKYIEHVKLCEGSDFMEKINDRVSSGIYFTSEEVRVLELLSNHPQE